VSVGPRAILSVVLALGCSAPAEPTEARSADVDVASLAPDSDLAQEACERCHVDEAREWRGSAHRTAFVDEVFQAEWRPGAQPACVACHAPLADPTEPEGPEATSGVSCVACHVRERSVLSTRAAALAPHAITVDPTFATADACAHCHDFSFAAVAPTPHDETASLQRTLHEAQEVEDRGPCQRCHMRDASERPSHGFPGARAPALLARALRVEATTEDRGARTEVTLVLTSLAGHAVPTGDVYRRLEVRAWDPGEPGDEGAHAILTRVFTADGGISRETRDDRVPPRGERRVVLSLPRTTRVAWRITWQALDPALAEARWLPSEDVARTVAEGVALPRSQR
jgi:hypothetical protein